MATEYKNIKPTRDYHSIWLSENSTPPEGALCLTYNRGYSAETDEILLVEYFIGDGRTTYSQFIEQDRIYGYYKVAPHVDANGIYGIANVNQFGHVKATDSIPVKASLTGNAGTDNGLYARGNHSHPSELPDQNGQQGKYLTTDGTNPAWSTVSSLLDITIEDNGKFLTNNGTNFEWTNLLQIPSPTGQSGKVLGTDGETLYWTQPDNNLNLSLKDVSGETVTYNGSRAVDLTNGVYYAATAGSCQNTTTSAQVTVNATSTSGVYYPTIVSGNGSQPFYYNTNLKYNPATGALTASKVYNAVYNDYAEYFPKGEETEPGDIIMLDIEAENEQYIKAIKNKGRVVGVHSDSYGHILGGENPEGCIDFEEYNNKKYIPVGLCGRCYVKVIGKINKGDFIVPSEIAGIGRAYNKDIDNKDDIIGFVVESDNDIKIRKLKMKIKN